jgi:hypothetical protein
VDISANTKRGGAACVRRRVARFDAFSIGHITHPVARGYLISYQQRSSFPAKHDPLTVLCNPVRATRNAARRHEILIRVGGLIGNGPVRWKSRNACQMSDIHVEGPEVVLIGDGRESRIMPEQSERIVAFIARSRKPQPLCHLWRSQCDKSYLQTWTATVNCAQDIWGIECW